MMFRNRSKFSLEDKSNERLKLFWFCSSDDSSDEAELLKPGYKDAEGNKILNGITISKTGNHRNAFILYPPPPPPPPFLSVIDSLKPSAQCDLFCVFLPPRFENWYSNHG